MKNKDNYIGTVIGFWTIVGNKVSNGRKVYLPCRCKCGKCALIYKSALLNNKSNGCVACVNGGRNKALTGSNSPSWKGGRHIDENGYVLIYQPSHPKAKKNGYVREHTAVMEAHLKRTLTKNESIHHLNGDRANNKLENLELWNKSQPYGQRVEDKVEWAIEILKEYAPECLNLH